MTFVKTDDGSVRMDTEKENIDLVAFMTRMQMSVDKIGIEIKKSNHELGRKIGESRDELRKTSNKFTRK